MEKRIHTVGIIAFNDDKVLLVKHGLAAEHLTGVWGLPGGRLNDGEELIEAAIREFEEETGLFANSDTMVKIPTIFEGDIPRKSGEILKTFWNVFLVRNYTGVLLDSAETAPHWITINEVSKHVTLPNTEKAIEEALLLTGNENLR